MASPGGAQFGMKVKLAELFAQLPPEWPESLLPGIADVVHRSGLKILVLDDDPTGTQTVYDVPVLTEWSVDSLAQLLKEPGELAYILTNSRSLPTAGAEALNEDIARNLLAAAKLQPRKFVVVSRSDSTLRGHYPAEVNAFINALNESFDATLIIPAFIEGGRFTIHDTHYVKEGEWLTPAAETESARDATFGYGNSDLRHWVSEKHADSVSPEDVASISICEEREGGPAVIAKRLEALSGGRVCVINAASYRDLEVFVAGLLIAESRGKRFFYRTAASFVRVRGGLAAHPLLEPHSILADSPTGTGGLIVAGSYVQRSSAQIAAMSSLDNLSSVEVLVDKLLNNELRDGEIQRAATAANAAIHSGTDALIFTSRQLVAGSDREQSLKIGNIVSASLVDIVRRITERPAWVIAKGGITSSDIATKALDVKRADVLGQAFPGVPVWRTGSDSRWPGLVYVVFPGNVGETGTMAKMVEILRNGSVAKV
jgi:uncharacterized protein YgbK (DUF1537 family)